MYVLKIKNKYIFLEESWHESTSALVVANANSTYVLHFQGIPCPAQYGVWGFGSISRLLRLLPARDTEHAVA